MIPSVPLPDAWRRKHLTKAEQKAVELVATGLAPKEIAAQLGKSTLTIRNQLHAAMRKLSVRNRYELIAAIHRLSVPLVTRSEENVEIAVLEYAI